MKKDVTKDKILSRLSNSGIIIILVVICVIMSFLSPYFLKPSNIMNILRQISNMGIISVGMAMVILVGEIDLSVGAVLAFSSCLSAFLAQRINPWLAISIAILLSGAIGYLNGFISIKVGVASFIGTLGMQNIIRGIAYLITGGIPIQFNNAAGILGGGTINISEELQIPFSVVIMFAVYFLGIMITKKTVFGRNLYAVGDNEKSARLSGINTDMTRIMAFVITGLLAGLVGVINAGNLTTAEASAGTSLEQDCIAAVVIGGISMTGGEGSIVGILFGAAIMGIIRNAFILLSFPASMQTIAIGLIIVVAVCVDCISKRRNLLKS